MSSSNTNLYEDSELKDIYYKKVKGLSLVGQTNQYSDLDNIPETFTSAEHVDMHPVVSSTQNGMMTSDVFNVFDNYHNFKKFKVINRDNSTITIDSDNFKYISGRNTVELSGDDSTKTISMLGSGLDTTGINFKQGDQGDSGQNGNDGYIWIPILENNVIRWELLEDTNIISSYNIQGSQGEKGSDGFQCLLLDITEDNPFLYGNDGELLKFNNENTFITEPLLSVLNEDYAIALYGFHRYRFAEMYGNKFKAIYNCKTGKFYTYNEDENAYINESVDFDRTNIFNKNSFILDESTNHVYYIDGTYEFYSII